MTYVALAVICLVVAFIAYQVVKPSIQRKAAVKTAVAKARAAASDGTNLPAQLRLAEVLTTLGGAPAEALALLERIDRDTPNYWTSEQKPPKILIGEAYVAMGKLDSAIEVFQRFVASVPEYETGGDKEKKWRLETFKVDAEQRIRLLKKGDTHVHAPEQWGDREE